MAVGWWVNAQRVPAARNGHVSNGHVSNGHVSTATCYGGGRMSRWRPHVTMEAACHDGGRAFFSSSRGASNVSTRE